MMAGRGAGERSRITQLLDSFLEERMDGDWPVSLTLTALALWQRADHCGLSELELAELVALRAIERGYHVAFDTDLLDGQ